MPLELALGVQKPPIAILAIKSLKSCSIRVCKPKKISFLVTVAAYMQPSYSWGCKEFFFFLISHTLSVSLFSSHSLFLHFSFLLGSLYYFIRLYLKIKTGMLGILLDDLVK